MGPPMEADESSRTTHPLRMVPPWAQSGSDLTRLLALSDGIFAFAMTLLVLGLALPAAFDPTSVGRVLVNLRPAFLAYALSFFVIWFYWLGHTQIFTYIVSFDRRLQQLNVTFLLFIAVMPFVTNLLSAANGQFLTVVLYAGNQIAAGGTLTLIWVYATGERRHVPRSLPEGWVNYVAVRSSVGPIVFAASIPIALVNPVWAEFSWVSLFIFQALVRSIHRRGPGGTGEGG